LFQGNLIRRAT